MPDDIPTFRFELGPTEIVSQNVRLRPDLVLDQVRLGTDQARYESRLIPGAEGQLTIDELNLQVVLSEPHLNRFIAANHPPDSNVRNVSVSLLSGKVRVSGQFVILFAIPFTLEAVLRIENGIRVVPEFLGLNASVVSLPASAVDLIEARLLPDLTLDLTRLPFPVYLDEVLCEPGRLSLFGKARIQWPAVPASSPPLLPANPDEPGLPYAS